MVEASADPSHPCHHRARRIIYRQHFKVVYRRSHDDVAYHPDPGRAVKEACEAKFGAETVRRSNPTQPEASFNFPVLDINEAVVSSLSASETLMNIPIAAADYVLVDPKYRHEVRRWIGKEKMSILGRASKIQED